LCTFQTVLAQADSLKSDDDNYENAVSPIHLYEHIN